MIFPGKNFKRNVFAIASLRTSLACLSGLLLWAAAWMTPHPALATVPSLLPDELQRPAAGKMVLLDFYSAYCGTCQMMEPHLKSLAARMNHNLHLERIDLGEPDNEKYLSQFEIQGTPTYILYDGNGKILYRMKDFIAPLVLERQVLRLTGQLKKTNFPSGVRLPSGHPLSPQGTSDAFNQMILVAFENQKCEPCREMSPYLQGFELSGQSGLHVLRIDTATPEGKKMMSALSIRQTPAYVLFDNNLAGSRPGMTASVEAGKNATETEKVPGKTSENTDQPAASPSTSSADPSAATPDAEKTTAAKTGNTPEKRGELFRITGKVPPRVLWNVIRMFGDAGV